MLKLLYTSDLHGNKPFYRRLLLRAGEQDVDAVAVGGDLCPRGGETFEEWTQFQREFLEEFLVPECRRFRKQHPNKEILLIMGNDDIRKNADVLERADKEGVLNFIHKRAVKLDGELHITGYGIVNTTPFRIKDWEKDDFAHSERPKMLSHQILRSVEQEQGTIAEDLEELKKQSDPRKTIFIMHAPPFNTNLDITHDRQHVGSEAIREFILSEKPPLTLHGHIHESPRMSGSWLELLGETVCVNVGSSYPDDILNCALIDVENPRNVQYLELKGKEGDV